MRRFPFFLVTILLLARPAPAADILYFTSSPTSWVGHGTTRLISDGYDFWASPIDPPNTGVIFYIQPFPISDWWQLSFDGPNRSQPIVGVYSNATRFLNSPPGPPGLSLVGDGRGDNTLTGNFQVLEAVFAPGGTPLKYAVDFTQYDEGVQSAWIHGSFRFNSDIPITVPEPSTLALLCLGSFGLMVRRKFASKVVAYA